MRIILSIFFLFFLTPLLFADPVNLTWSQRTPGGNEIRTSNGITSLLANGKVAVSNIKHYFFVTHHVAGESKTGFFLFDESSYHLENFKSRAELCTATHQQNLVYDNNLAFFPGTIPYDFFIDRYNLSFWIPFVFLFGLTWLVAKRSGTLGEKTNTFLDGTGVWILWWLGTVIIVLATHKARYPVEGGATSFAPLFFSVTAGMLFIVVFNLLYLLKGFAAKIGRANWPLLPWIRLGIALALIALAATLYQSPRVQNVNAWSDWQCTLGRVSKRS